MASTILLLSLSVLAHFTSAHFSVDYPYWRGNSFLAPASQYLYPCGGVNQSISGNNRTTWPLTGGSLSLDLHHPFTYLFINLGLGSNVTAFNISLTPLPLNETGNGTLCFSQVALPAGLNLQEGANASIQVTTVGDGGSALYNCADITFSSKAVVLSGDQCKDSTGVSVISLAQQNANGTSTTSTSSAATPSASKTSGATARFRRAISSISVVAVLASGLNYML